MTEPIRFRNQHSLKLFHILMGAEEAIFQLVFLKALFYPKINARLPLKQLKKVLDITTREINQKTDINVYYFFIEDGDQISHVRFTIAPGEPFRVN